MLIRSSNFVTVSVWSGAKILFDSISRSSIMCFCTLIQALWKFWPRIKTIISLRIPQKMASHSLFEKYFRMKSIWNCLLFLTMLALMSDELLLRRRKLIVDVHHRSILCKQKACFSRSCRKWHFIDIYQCIWKNSQGDIYGKFSMRYLFLFRILKRTIIYEEKTRIWEKQAKVSNTKSSLMLLIFLCGSVFLWCALHRKNELGKFQIIKYCK